MVPVGLTEAGGALVACTAAVGTAVGWAAGTDVAAAGAEVACGTAVGEVVSPLEAGSEVAEDPQANSNATKSSTTAFGKCRITRGLKADCGTYLPPLLRFAINDRFFMAIR